MLEIYEHEQGRRAWNYCWAGSILKRFIWMTRKFLTTELTETALSAWSSVKITPPPPATTSQSGGDKRSANWKWKMIANTDQIGRAGRGGRRYQLLSYVITATTIMFPVFFMSVHCNEPLSLHLNLNTMNWVGYYLLYTLHYILHRRV